MKQAAKKLTGPIKKGNVRVALVASRFNADICEGLIGGALAALKEAGLQESQRDLYRVPGAFEIPLAAQKCALSKKYRGVICLGAVIRGETPHFEMICQAVTQGLSQLSLTSGLPIGFGVITTNNIDQARARSFPDDYNKGREAALTVLEMIDLLRKM